MSAGTFQEHRKDRRTCILRSFYFVQVFALISAPHLGQVITIFPLPVGTRQMVLQLLQVKYLCSLSVWRALAPALRFFTPQYQFTHR